MRSPLHRTRLLAIVLPGLLLLSVARVIDASTIPPDLAKLEKLVGLELAHVRDAGPTDPAKRKMLFYARQLDQHAEDSIKSGDYKSAEENLLKARVLLRQLND
jgi:hypothetical protein